MSRCFSRLRIGFVAAGLACTACARAGAQGGSSPFPPRPADPACADYLAAAVALQPTVTEANLGLTLARLHGCIPELGRGIAAAATALRGTSDTSLAVLAFHGGQAYRDTAIFRAARTIATDPAASEVMRVMSLLVLLSYPAPGQGPLYNNVIGHPPGSAACAYTIATDAPDTLGISPVPASAIDDARDAARAVLADPTASARLTSAAYCVVEAWRAARGKPGNAHWTLSASQLSVDYVCGTRFRLRNMHPVPISVEWRAGSSSSSLSRLILPRPAPGATFSEITIDVNAPGDLALYVDGEPIVSRANLGTSCI